MLYPAFGLLVSPVIAAAAMSFSSVSVVGNALRLNAPGPEAAAWVTTRLAPWAKTAGGRMCGIVAAFSARDVISANVLERGTRRLFHRGPDGQRWWISKDGHAGLGHARLSIIDLATGDQPIASEDERTRSGG